MTYHQTPASKNCKIDNPDLASHHMLNYQRLSHKWMRPEPVYQGVIERSELKAAVLSLLVCIDSVNIVQL